MRHLVLVLILAGLLVTGCSTAPLTTTTRMPSTTTTSLVPSTTSTTDERTAITFAVDLPKLEPAWKAYAATISAIEARLGYEQFQLLLHTLATEVELLAQQRLSAKERVFADELRAAIANFKTGLAAWDRQLTTPATANQEAMQKAWTAAREHGDKAGAILRGE